MNTIKSEKRWCVWKKIPRGNDNDSKVPYMSPSSTSRPDDPSTWITFEDATNLLNAHPGTFAGRGFFLSAKENDPTSCVCVIDLDAHGKNAPPNPHTEELLSFFAGTYAERSPSGKGHHIICTVRKTEIPIGNDGKPAFSKKNPKEELEIYIGGFDNRYFTYTGDMVSICFLQVCFVGNCI